MQRTLSNIWRDDSGQDLIEYALLAGLLCVMAVAIPFPLLNQSLVRIWAKVSEQFTRLTGT